MSFEIRSNLLRTVGNNAEAYSVAFGFVQDDKDKLAMFNQAWLEQQSTDPQERSALAAGVAEARWLIMYPEPQE